MHFVTKKRDNATRHRSVRRKRNYSRLFAVAALVAVSLSPLAINRQVLAAEGDIVAVRVLGETVRNGWVAEIDIEDMATGGTYDMGITPSTAGSAVNANAKVRFTVTSPGYDTAGSPTQVTRYVYGTSALRQPYPNQASADEVSSGGITTIRISLSEFIYSGDTVTVDIGAGLYTVGAATNASASNFSVTNNSTNAYPKPVGRWAWTPYERVKSDFLLEAVAFHRFGQNAKPLATMTFTCQDEHSASHSITVNDMTVSTRPDPANTDSAVLVYAATMPIAGFTQGDIITCNFVAYPWVGNSSALLNSDLAANGGDGVAQPDERLGPFALLNDKDSTYGEPCAIVSATGQASNASTWVYPSCAAAEAAYAGNNTLAYADIGRAAQAIKAYNAANHGHDDPGGGTIALQAANYSNPGTAPGATMGTQKTWLTIKPASNVACQAPVINANGNTPLRAQKLKYSCLSTQTTTGNTFHGVEATDLLWLDQMKINSTEGSPIRRWKAIYATDNTIDALNRGLSGIFSSTRWPSALVRGNNYTPLNSTIAAPMRASMNSVLGNKGIVPQAAFIGDYSEITDNSIYAFNQVLNSNNSSPEISISSSTQTNFPKGMAIVQNVIESAIDGNQPTVAIENMGGTDSINNLLYWHNTTRGQRSNVAYAASSALCEVPLPLFTNWSWKYNADSNNNRIDEDRSDHGCPADGRRIGNWSMTYMVGASGNALAVGNGPSYSPADYIGLNSVNVPVAAGFVNDKSSTTYGGAGGGGGNYRLTAGSSLRNIVPSGQALLPYDLDGTARSNSGSGALGAYAYSSEVPPADITAPTITSFSIPPNGSSRTVGGITFTATDDTAVTGYALTESASAPGVNDAIWQVSAPTQYTFASYGAKTLYAWAKDAAGNISTSASDTTTLTEPTYTIGGTTSGLTGTVVLHNNGGDALSVSSGSFTFAAPLTSGATYAISVATQPAEQTCTVSNGSGTIASANVSNVLVTCTTNPTPGDTMAPTITSFTIPASASSLTITGIDFTAADDTAVTGYILTESASAPAASSPAWQTSAPSQYTFGSYGTKTLYAWAKDAAGNVSTNSSGTTTLTNPVVEDTFDFSTLPAERNTAPTPALAQAMLSIASESCYTIDNSSVRTLDINGLRGYEQSITLLGGIGFNVTCATSGDSTAVTITLAGHYPDTSRLRAYKQHGASSALTDITNQVAFTNRAAGGSIKTVITYSLVDGGLLDEDADANGIIIDPIYIGMTQNGNTRVDGLAQTGIDVHKFAMAGIIYTAVGIIAMCRYIVKRRHI